MEIPAAFHLAAGRAARRAVDTILPPRCLGCGALVGAPGTVCPECWRGIDFITAPYCHGCGLPFACETGPDALCGGCAGDTPVFTSARSVMAYNDTSRRLMSRRYNQAALMAQALGRKSGLPVLVDALIRTRSTPSQGKMSRIQRERNAAGAFAVRESRQPAVKDARIVLIDDVMTTGATLTACGRPLLRAGAGRVDALTLPRVIRTG